MNLPPILRLVIGGSDLERSTQENIKQSGLLMVAINSLKQATQPDDLAEIIGRTNDGVEKSREQ